MKLLNKEQLKKAEEALRHYFPYSQQAYGYVYVMNRKQADPLDVLVDQWPDFSVLLIRPQRHEKADLFKLISIYTKDEMALKNVLTRTDALDWKQYLRISVDQRFEEVINAVAVSRGLPMNKMYVCRVMKLQDPSNLTTKRLPLQISSLNESNISLVCSTWKYNQGEFSESFIRDMIRNFSSLCVLDAEGQPLSWLLTYASGSMGMLYTLPEHRRKGYAKALVTIMAKKLHSEGYPVYCLIEEQNEPSYRLFTSLGFTADPLYKISGFKFNQT